MFPPPQDAVIMAEFAKEATAKLARRVIVYPFSSKLRNLEADIYGEDLDVNYPKEDSYETPCWLTELPSKQAELTRAGVDESRQLQLVFNRDLIEEAGKPLPRTGFHVLIENELYEIMQENPTQYFASIDRTFSWTCIVQRYRPSSIPPPTEAI
jgi:hypothetical protein